MLKTDYKDDILNTEVNINRKFNIVRSNGTLVEQNVELRETTVFEQEGDSFGAKDINETNEAIVDVREQIHTNLLNPTLATTTINGVTCTNNGDGTYTLTGTATAHTDIRVTPWGTSEYANLIQLEPNKKYKIIGSPSGNSVNTYFMCVVSNNGTTRNNIAWDYNNDGVFTSLDSAYHYEIKISVTNGTALPSGGLTFKPMLTTDLDATYNDYVPYSGDGRLNENVAEIYNKVEEHETRLDSAETTIGNHTEEIAQINADLSERIRVVIPHINIAKYTNTIDLSPYIPSDWNTIDIESATLGAYKLPYITFQHASTPSPFAITILQNINGKQIDIESSTIWNDYTLRLTVVKSS